MSANVWKINKQTLIFKKYSFTDENLVLYEQM